MLYPERGMSPSPRRKRGVVMAPLGLVVSRGPFSANGPAGDPLRDAKRDRASHPAEDLNHDSRPRSRWATVAGAFSQGSLSSTRLLHTREGALEYHTRPS